MTYQPLQLSQFLVFSVVLFLGSICPWLIAADSLSTCPRTVELLKTGSETVRIACLGDSLTGVYYHTGGRRAYADMLAIALKKIYPNAKIEIINAGLSGDTTQGALKRLDCDVLAHHPHLVTIMLGMNDVCGVSSDKYRKNLVELITRCRATGAEIILCTSNSVVETIPRPSSKLENFMQIVRDIAKDENLAVADCYQAYQALREKKPREWTLMMSDEIHPNMDGHKLIAKTIAKTLTHQTVSLEDIGPLQPAIPHTLQLLRTGKPIKVYAMPPFDSLIGPALRELEPSAIIEVTKWDVAGKGITAIEESAKKVRMQKPDLVIVAVPEDIAVNKLETNEQIEAFHRSYSWVLNWSLSFGRQEWDCIAIPLSVAKKYIQVKHQLLDQLVYQMIRAQDIDGPVRKEGDSRTTDDLLRAWLHQQWGIK